MALHARIDAREMNGTRLYRDFVSSGGAALAPWLPRFGAAACRDAMSRPVRVDGELVSVLRERNHALGVRDGVIEKLAGLSDGTVRAVVTGQQPGVAGGPLMSLYKAAAAIALARRIEATGAGPCVPVFWLGSDDDDFAEVRELSVLGADHARLDVSLDASAYRPGLRVGDIDAAAVRAAWSAVAPVVPAGEGRERTGALLAGAADFADAAARMLVAATGGEIAVVDGRAASLRAAARDLLLDFFDREAVLRERLEAGSRELEARGYHAQVQWGGDAGLFLVRDGVRQRVPPERREGARAEFARDIAQVSPGVVARNLLQDAVLAPLAVVLGPAEVAYRAQMAGVYDEMKVPMPVVFPRLSATYLPPGVDEMVRESLVDVRDLVRDPSAAANAVASRSASGGLKDAAAGLESHFDREARAFVETALPHLDAKAGQKLDKRMDEIRGRLSQALAGALESDVRGPRSRWPFLPRLADMFLRDGAPQERFLSMLVPMLHHGEAAWASIDGMATEWSADVLDGRAWHGVYSV